ncbi:hypothetical protein E2493_07275 [Sphingomonas parva]|uniref:Uncharacterized protein n=1 Tax=Sphingomonas parva TaxID=2555898 RepID=A0A4Y8ZS53_9SPHN|nr:hypothetical protein [Sphingomonas parva]TFI58860.1 hypothetical protein E2493_07275 [Sphingomonas parva]
MPLYILPGILLAKALQPTAVTERPLVITVPAAVLNPGYWNVPVKICGKVVLDGMAEQVALRGSDQRLRIAPAAKGLPKTGVEDCLTGVVRRTDTEQRPSGARADTPPTAASRDLIFRLCSTQADCVE